MAVLCAVAGYVGAEQGRQVEGELGSAGRLGEMRGPVGIGRGATYPFPLRGGLSGCLALVVASQDGALPQDPRGRAGGRDSAAGRAGAPWWGAET